MERELRFLIVLAMSLAMLGQSSGAEAQQESFGDKIKHLFGHKKPTPTPTPKPKRARTPSPTSNEPGASELLPQGKPSSTPIAKQTAGPNATISTAEISDFESNPPETRRLIEIALDLTSRNLEYSYSSADPTRGGMDCSGFVYYVLTKIGVPDVPRDAREQYAWIRKAGNFQAVLGHSDDTFEMNALQPGDLLFWSDPHSQGRDAAITETMIYLGRERATNQRIMVGATEDRSYKNQLRKGVSVVDFKVLPAETTSSERPARVFVGYGRVPGLSDR